MDTGRHGVLDETLQRFVNGDQTSVPFINVQSPPALLAVVVYAHTGDTKLAQRIIDIELQPAALVQADPCLSDEARALIAEHRATLCAALGLPNVKRKFSEPDAAAPRKAIPESQNHHHGRTLHKASYLTGSRLRVSLNNASPHFWSDHSGAVICNGCRQRLRVHSDEDLRARLYAPAWSAMRWKTFLCDSCRERAMLVDDDIACFSCWRPSQELEHIPLRYAEIDNPDQPRQLPLCAECKRDSHTQLTTVVWTGKA